MGQKRVPGILFADDLGLTATLGAGLRRLIKITEEEGASFNMKVLIKKSKIMILSAKKEIISLFNQLEKIFINYLNVFVLSKEKEIV